MFLLAKVQVPPRPQPLLFAQNVFSLIINAKFLLNIPLFLFKKKKLSFSIVSPIFLFFLKKKHVPQFKLINDV